MFITSQNILYTTQLVYICRINNLIYLNQMKRKIFLSLCAALWSAISLADTFSAVLPNGTVVNNGGSAHIYCPDPSTITFHHVMEKSGSLTGPTVELFLENTLVATQQLDWGDEWESGVEYVVTLHVVPGNYKIRVKKSNLVGFVDAGTISVDEVPLYTGFGTASTWSTQFNSGDGFNQTNGTLRAVADVNGDGKDDIVGFGLNDVKVSLCNGSSFATSTTWHTGWSNAQGWNATSLKRCLADVNADGRADIVGFGSDGVYVSLSTGTSFGPSVKWSNGWGTNNGWSNSGGLQREVKDVNMDGRADIVGFTTGGAFVAVSSGTSFGNTQQWSTGWGPENGWGGVNQRVLADVDGDNRVDIIGFNSTGAYVSKSTGTAFGSSALWTTGFNNTNGWHNTNLLRTVIDVTGDGNADIVGFGWDGVYVSRSNPGTNSFNAAQRYISGFDYYYGYSDSYPRLLGRFNSDSKADIAGFGSVVTVSLSNGNYACDPWYKSLVFNDKINYANPGETISLGSETISDVFSSDLDFFPNPSENKISIKGLNAESEYQIQITDVRGIVLIRKSVNSMNNSISTDELASGNYFVTISNGDQIITKKLVKQ